MAINYTPKTSEIKTLRGVIIGMACLIALIGALAQTIWGAVFINLSFLLIAWMIYSGKEFKKDVGVYRSGFGFISFGVLFGGVSALFFFLATKFIPGLSLAFPVIPASIGGTLTFFFVVIVAPFSEEVFFRGGLLAYFKKLFPNSKHLPIWLQAILFAIWHLGAYILGFYMLPNFIAGLDSFIANISVFITALLFGLVAGYGVDWKGKITARNLWYSSTFHLLLNLIAFGLSVATFVLVGGLIFG